MHAHTYTCTHTCMSVCDRDWVFVLGCLCIHVTSKQVRHCQADKLHAYRKEGGMVAQPEVFSKLVCLKQGPECNTVRNALCLTGGLLLTWVQPAFDRPVWCGQSTRGSATQLEENHQRDCQALFQAQLHWRCQWRCGQSEEEERQRSQRDCCYR